MFLKISGNENHIESVNFNQLNSNNSVVKKVVLCNKGEAGYSALMDLDDDGVLTLDEFDEYCAKNGISGEEKAKLLLTMHTAKNREKFIKESKKEREEKEKAEKEKAKTKASNEIYTRKEETQREKINNKEDKVAFNEYIDYCERYTKSQENKTYEKNTQIKEIKEFQKKEVENPQLSVEVRI